MWIDFLRPEQIGEDQKQLYTWEGLCQWVDLSKEQSGIYDVWTSQAVLGSSWQSLAWSSAMVQGSNCEHGRNKAQHNSREEQTVKIKSRLSLQKIGRIKQRLFQIDWMLIQLRALKKDICTKCTTTISTTLFLCLLVQEQQLFLQLCSSRLGMDLKLILHRRITKSGNRSLVIWSSFKRLYLMCWQFPTYLSHLYIKELRPAVWICKTHKTILQMPKLYWNCFTSKVHLEFLIKVHILEILES